MAKTQTKTTPKQFQQYRELLQDKAREIRRSIATPAGAEILANRAEINDMADLAGQSHEEWIFLYQNAHNANLLRHGEDGGGQVCLCALGVCDACGQSYP